MPDNLKPSLSPEGWIKPSNASLDDLLADFFYAEYSQSTIYYGEVASLPWILSRYPNNYDQIAELTHTTLSKYLCRHFNEVFLDVKASADAVNPNRAVLHINVTAVNAEGVQFTAGKALKILNSKLQEFINENNKE